MSAKHRHRGRQTHLAKIELATLSARCSEHLPSGMVQQKTSGPRKLKFRQQRLSPPNRRELRKVTRRGGNTPAQHAKDPGLNPQRVRSVTLEVATRTRKETELREQRPLWDRSHDRALTKGALCQLS